MLFAEEGAGLVFTGGEAATSTLITFLLGIGIVFIGLIALILIIKVMGAVMKSAQKKRPAVESKAAAEPAQNVPEGDRGEIIAAVSARVIFAEGSNAPFSRPFMISERYILRTASFAYSGTEAISAGSPSLFTPSVLYDAILYL